MPTGLGYTAYLLALIGGIITIITGAIQFLSESFTLEFATGLFVFGPLVRSAFEIVLGIIATIGARYADTLGWAIGLIIIGLIAGNIGGLLILVGGILGIVYRNTRTR